MRKRCATCTARPSAANARRWPRRPEVSQASPAPRRPSIRASLLRAYRQSSYETGDIVVRIGRHSLAMDGLLASAGAKQAVFITAYNPFSRLMPPGWNVLMQARLAEVLRRYPVLPARGYCRAWSA